MPLPDRSLLQKLAGGILVISAVAVGCALPLDRGAGPDPRSTPSSAAPSAEGGDQPAAPAQPPAQDPEPAGPAAEVVVVVTIDGLTPDALPLVERGATSRGGLHRLANEGASTLNARTTVEQSTTLPNHTALLTGRRVYGPTGTGIDVNEDPGGTLESQTGRYVPGIFDVAHDHGVPTGMYAEKPKFAFLVRSWDEENGAQDAVQPDDGTDKLDRVVIGTAAEAQDAAISDLASGRVRLAFLHMAGPDTAGHRDSWLSRPYLDAVRAADTELGALLRTIDEDPRLRGKTTVIVTADHGGRGRGHNDPLKEVNYTIPFYAWGAGVDAGDLYDFNPSRVDPGEDQLAYEGGQPIRNIDAANLALSLLGLPLLPYYTEGAAEPLRMR